MRMRLKKWARPELSVCPYFVKEPIQFRGKWIKAFEKEQPLWLELGCGKGSFLSQYALAHPEINFIGVDLISDMLGVARRRISADFENVGRNVSNLLLTSFDIARIENYFSSEDSVKRIFINFCNPWPRPKQYKKRLTHVRQLLQYRQFLVPKGELHFKTDDDELFRHTLSYINEAGFSLLYSTQNLHQSGYEENYMTEHEAMYSEKGIPIKFLIAKKEDIR